MDTYIKASMRDTLDCASALRPCFINRFVKSAKTGSVAGGIAVGAYPLDAERSTIRGPALDGEGIGAAGVIRAALRISTRPPKDCPAEDEDDEGPPD